MSAVVMFVTLLACGGRDEAVPAETTEERAATSAGDVAAVDPDTVGWIQRGEVLEWGNRRWILAGEPIHNPILAYVGTANGLDLYASPERMPSERLFFHLGGDRWQMLESHVGPGTAGDTTGATLPPADTLPVR